jgi:hypothetical protein
MDFLNDLRIGRYHGVFIDDTGSPGLTSPTKLLHPDRKSFVAVLVSADDIAEVLHQMPRVIKELKLHTGATEFHFADIYNGRRAFKNLDLDLRLSHFRFMAHIFTLYRFPIIVQTFDPITLQDLHRRANLPTKKVGPFNLEKQEDLALFFLLLRVKWYMEGKCNTAEMDGLSTGVQGWIQTHSIKRARVFVDEGFKKNGIAVTIPTFEGQFVDGLICFARSDAILPLQLADFAAFALNRTQILMAKAELSDLDRKLLTILSPVALNYQNILKKILLLDPPSGTRQ